MLLVRECAVRVAVSQGKRDLAVRACHSLMHRYWHAYVLTPGGHRASIVRTQRVCLRGRVRMDLFVMLGLNFIEGTLEGAFSAQVVNSIDAEVARTPLQEVRIC